MGFRVGSYATVWSVEPKTDAWTKINITVSRKNKDTGEYDTEFRGFVDCFGTAVAKKAAALTSGDRIKLGDIDVKTSYDKQKEISYTNFQLFNFELTSNESGDATAKKEPKKPAKSVDDGEVEVSEGALPF